MRFEGLAWATKYTTYLRLPPDGAQPTAAELNRLQGEGALALFAVDGVRPTDVCNLYYCPDGRLMRARLAKSNDGRRPDDVRITHHTLPWNVSVYLHFYSYRCNQDAEAEYMFVDRAKGRWKTVLPDLRTFVRDQLGLTEEECAGLSLTTSTAKHFVYHSQLLRLVGATVDHAAAQEHHQTRDGGLSMGLMESLAAAMDMGLAKDDQWYRGLRAMRESQQAARDFDKFEHLRDDGNGAAEAEGAEQQAFETVTLANPPDLLSKVIGCEMYTCAVNATHTFKPLLSYEAVVEP
jgi:hypothetical protein